MKCKLEKTVEYFRTLLISVTVIEWDVWRDIWVNEWMQCRRLLIHCVCVCVLARSISVCLQLLFSHTHTHVHVRGCCAVLIAAYSLPLCFCCSTACNYTRVRCTQRPLPLLGVLLFFLYLQYVPVADSSTGGEARVICVVRQRESTCLRARWHFRRCG